MDIWMLAILSVSIGRCTDMKGMIDIYHFDLAFIVAGCICRLSCITAFYGTSSEA